MPPIISYDRIHAIYCCAPILFIHPVDVKNISVPPETGRLGPPARNHMISALEMAVVATASTE